MSAALLSWRRATARFRKNREGAVAVEFGLVAIPFFMLIFGLIEIALIGMAQTSLDLAASDMARRIRTGEVQSEGLGEDDLRNEMCGTIDWILNANCDQNLSLDITRYESFVDVSNANPIQDGQFSDAGFQFQPGAASDIILVRAFLEWNMVTPWFQGVFANTSGGARVLATSLMFRNEPFPEEAPGGGG